MKKRLFLMLAIVIAFVAAIGGFKYFQIKAAMAQHANFQMPPEAVTTTVAKQEMWDTTLNAIGSVEAAQGVTVSADLPGVVEAVYFDSGQQVGKGAVLVRLDTRQERAQLAAAEAQRNLARLGLERKQGLLQKNAIPQALFDQASAEYKGAEARAGEIRAAIDRKTIRAPFSGALGIRQVNVGQFLAPGAPIVSLQALSPVYVNFSLPQQEVGKLRQGASLAVKSDAFDGVETGRVVAFDSVVDEATRNVRVQAIFDNRGAKMRPGMFVEAQLTKGAVTPIVAVPASSIAYAPFGDSVFIVENVKGPDGKTFRGVRQQFVKLGGARGDVIAITSGIKPGEEVVTSGVFKLRPGAAVVVNNSIQPGSSMTPKPEDS
jgi:membrane fusion protein (multidrug efflux system)